MDVKPATLLDVPTWTNLSLYRSLTIQEGGIVPSLTCTVTKATCQFLGDGEGRPVQALNLAPGTSNPPSTFQLPLDEMVTRLDGTQLTVLQLLDSLAMAAQPPAPPAL